MKISEQQHALSHEWDTEQQDNNIVPLTRVEAEKLFGSAVSRPSRITPFWVVIAQVVLSLVVALVWWLCAKSPGVAAQSALLGGAIGWVPSALFALRMKYGKVGSMMGWVVGEVLKISATIAMFFAVIAGYPGLHWVPLLVTYLVTLKVYWVALAWR